MDYMNMSERIDKRFPQPKVIVGTVYLNSVL